MRAREHRHKVMIGARMRAGGLPADICIRDISSRGMLIQSGIAPPRGTYVEVITPTETIVGRVVWGDEERFGINTRDKLHVALFIGGRRAGPADDLVQKDCRTARARPSVALESAGSRVFEFAILVAFAAAAVTALGSVAYQTLARPFEEVASRVRNG